jgi:Mg-chelatase subunit ChlD
MPSHARSETISVSHIRGFSRMGYEPTSEERRPRVTLHSHAELRVLAADVAGQVPDESFKPGVEDLRVALGIGEAEPLECWLLVDRSGSVLFDRDELQQVNLAWHFASFDSEHVRIGILGFSGFGDYVNLFEFKTPLNTADRALLLVADCGGGGTPTAEAIAHATRMLKSSPAEHKLVVVVTDAPANDTAQCARAVRAANSEGVRVIGVLKPENRHQHPGADNSAFMSEQFGTDWLEVDSYTRTPQALLEHVACTPRPDVGEERVRHRPSDGRIPTERERLIVVAADALLALGDTAACELSERTLGATDPELRTLAHYLRMRREELRSHGDELFGVALKAARAGECS